jgi:hypothetical protein
METLIKTAGLQADIRTQDLPNTNQELTAIIVLFSTEAL